VLSTVLKGLGEHDHAIIRKISHNFSAIIFSGGRHEFHIKWALRWPLIVGYRGNLAFILACASAGPRARSDVAIMNLNPNECLLRSRSSSKCRMLGEDGFQPDRKPLSSGATMFGRQTFLRHWAYPEILWVNSLIRHLTPSAFFFIFFL
jgi:hypothetical protein